MLVVSRQSNADERDEEGLEAQLRAGALSGPSAPTPHYRDTPHLGVLCIQYCGAAEHLIRNVRSVQRDSQGAAGSLG